MLNDVTDYSYGLNGMVRGGKYVLKADVLTALTAKDAEIAALNADYLRACQTVAAMHEAATGRVGEAPRLGVVEDVAEVRKNAERYHWLNSQTGVVWLGLAKIADRSACIDAAMAQAVQA